MSLGRQAEELLKSVRQVKRGTIVGGDRRGLTAPAGSIVAPGFFLPVRVLSRLLWFFTNLANSRGMKPVVMSIQLAIRLQGLRSCYAA